MIKEYNKQYKKEYLEKGSFIFITKYDNVWFMS